MDKPEKLGAFGEKIGQTVVISSKGGFRIVSNDRPDDVPEWAWDEAAKCVGPWGKIEGDKLYQEVVARAIFKAKSETEITDEMVMWGASAVAAWFGSGMIYDRHEALARSVLLSATRGKVVFK